MRTRSPRPVPSSPRRARAAHARSLASALASLALGLAPLLQGCSSPYGSGADVPNALAGAPWTGEPGDAAVLQARGELDRGDTKAALAAADAVLAEHPRHVDAHRLRQDALRLRGRIGAVLHEAEQRVRDWGGDPNAHYLRGRVQSDDADKLRDFRHVVRVAPQSFWGWLGLAFVLRERSPEDSLSIYRAMYRATQAHPLVAVALGAALRAAEIHAEALTVYDRLRASDVLEGVGELGMAETYLSTERQREAWPPLLQCLRERPFDSGARRLVETYLAAGLPDQQVEQLLDVLYEDPQRLVEFGRDHGAVVLAALLERRGNLPAAREALMRHGPPSSSPARRHWRRTLLSTGDVRAFLRATAREFPAPLLDDERNQVRALWVSVLRGPWVDAPDPLARPEWGLELARALLRAGMLEESDMVATLSLERHHDRGSGEDRGADTDAAGDAERDEDPDRNVDGDLDDRDLDLDEDLDQIGERLLALRDEARREIAFEGALRRLVYQGYGSPSNLSLDPLLDHVRRLSREILGEDVVGEPTVFKIPFVGRLIDPFSEGLGTHFARYNRHLVLGQRDGGPPEGLLLVRLSLRYLEPSSAAPLEGRCWQVVCEDRRITSLQGVLGGDLAGVALLNHYVVDMDAVRDWATTIRDQRRVMREDGDALISDPVPESIDALDPADVHWRLARMSPLEDTEVEQAVFDMICWHERGHLVDSFRYLPPESNLWRVLGLAFSHGFNAFSIESEMEGRAEATALAHSPHTELVLAHIASFLAESGHGSAHATGFRRLARRLNQALAKHPDHAENARVSRWHRVPPREMRQIARRLAPQP